MKSKVLSPLALTDEKKGIIFRALSESPIYGVGVQFGFDKHYADSQGVKNAVYRIYQEVQKDPERYGLGQEVCDKVVATVANRNANPEAREASTSLREKLDVKGIDENDYAKLVLSGRTKAMKLLHKKLDTISTKKEIKAINIAQLATVAAILFDKGQIIQGQATENIAIMAKIDDNLSPESALDAVLKMREANMASKEKVK